MRRGLIEQQDHGRQNQGTSERDALAFSAREPIDERQRATLETLVSERFERTLAPLRIVRPIGHEREQHVLEGGHPRDEGEILKEITDLASTHLGAVVITKPRYGLAFDTNLTRGRQEHAPEQTE